MNNDFEQQHVTLQLFFFVPSSHFIKIDFFSPLFTLSSRCSTPAQKCVCLLFFFFFFKTFMKIIFVYQHMFCYTLITLLTFHIHIVDKFKGNSAICCILQVEIVGCSMTLQHSMNVINQNVCIHQKFSGWQKNCGILKF